ncbi:MAG: TPM domain-containing protein [Acidobacteria bacterium]|nr:TPM domain-containing protein [Acidobacteriota bacterium]
MKSAHKSLLPLLLSLVCAVVTTTFAQQQSFPQYVGHVNDFANVIEAQTENQLETILTNFEKLTNTQIAVVTVQSLNDRPIEDYANDLYRAWGIGQKTGENKDKGALLLIALGDRKTRLEVGYGLEGDLPDGLAGEIIRRMRPFLQQQQYSQGINVGVRTLVDTLAQKWNISLEGIEDRSYAYSGPAQPRELSGRTGLIFLLLFLSFIFIMFIIARSNRKRGGRSSGRGAQDLWWTYPIIFNRGGGTFGGGSWGSSGGGGDSGGSDWGGFGGGSSGGGGASDSW